MMKKIGVKDLRMPQDYMMLEKLTFETALSKGLEVQMSRITPHPPAIHLNRH